MNEEIMKKMGFEDEVEKVKQHICPTCNKPIPDGSFRDAVSKREYRISGMCQDCQDSVFEGGGDYD